MANPCRSCGCATADQPPAGASRSTSQARTVTRTPSYRPDSQPARPKTPSTPLVASTWATQPPGPDPRRTYGRDHLAVALGVGTAVVTGWGAGVACADASGSSPGSTTSSAASGATNAESGGATHDTRKPKGGKRTTSATKPDKRTADATDDGNPSDPSEAPGGKGGVTQS